jgi:hypothetical protein
MSRNSRTISAGIKLGIFTVASVLVTGLLVAIMGNIGFGSGEQYKAVFSNASMLQEGDDVRIAGVNVGDVQSVEHYQRNNAVVTFQVKDEINLTTASTAEIRFLNLVGDRYMALERGSDADAQPLEPDGTIPIEQTGPRPHGPLQRLPAAVPGAAARPGQRAEPQPRPGAAGGGRDRRVPHGEDGLAHQHPRRPRPAHRRGHHQPHPDPRHRRPAP